MCSSATSSSTRRKWWDTSEVTAGRSAWNASTICAAATASVPAVSRIGLRTCSSNRSTARTARPRIASSASRASAEQVSERQTELEQPERRADHLDVAGRVPRLTVDASCPIRIPSRSTAWISEAGTPLADGERVEGHELASSAAPRRARPRRPRRDRRRRARARRHHPADRGEREPLPCRARILPDPLGVLVAVPGDATFRVRLGQQPARLVVADGVDRDVAGRRELLDPIPHDRALYECSLTRSSLSHRRLLGTIGRRTGPRGYDAPRESQFVARAGLEPSPWTGARVPLRDAAGRRRQKAPCAGGDWATAASTGCVLHRHRAAVRDRAARRRAPALLRRVRRPRRATATSTRS